MSKRTQIKIDLRKIDRNKVDILSKQFVDQMSSDVNAEGSVEGENLCLLTYMETFLVSYLAAMGGLQCLTEDRMQLFRKMVSHIESKIPELEEWSVNK